MKLNHLPNHGAECQGCLILELLGALGDILNISHDPEIERLALAAIEKAHAN